MKKIALNFVPLKEQHFSIKVFRKERNYDDPKNKNRDIFALYMPDGENPPKQYWLSFIEQEGYEIFSCDSALETALTNRYVFYLLQSRCIEVLKKDIDFNIYVSYAIKRIEFKINSFPEGEQIVWLTPFFLESNSEFGFILDFKFVSKKEQVFNRRVQQLSLSLNNEFKSNNNLYNDKFNMLKQFARAYYKNVFANTILDFGGFTQLNVFQLNVKTYQFKDNKEEFYPSTGLRKWGPYKAVEKPVLFYFLRNEDEKDKALKLYNALRGVGLENEKYYTGLENTYKLIINQENIKGLNSEKYKFIEEIEKVASEIKEKHPNENVIIFAFTPKKEETGYTKKRYLAIKYGFSQHNIPVQFVQYGTITSPYALNSSIANIALAVFAKLGGEPWKMKPTSEDCLVLGISQTIYRSPGTRTRKYVAYSVLLDTGGIYKNLEVLSNDEQIESHFENLRKNLKKVLREQTEIYKRIVLHVTFKLKKDELDIIKETLNEFSDDIDFVVVRINVDNIFWGYDQSKAHLTPMRNSYISISNTKFLLWLEGVKNDFEVPEKRFAGPIYIDFFYSSKELSENDIQNYLQDLLNLSGANWRGLNAKAIPVSVHYCKMVSEYIKDFKEVLNVDELKNEFNNPWFL